MISDSFRDPASLPPRLRFLAGGGEATRLILARDWSNHPLGPPEGWPVSLKSTLSTVLNSPESMILSWGREELFFFFNETYTTNGNIWEYEVMEAFIHLGTNDPATYLELEVAPNNVTYQSWIYNPSKVRTEGAAFDHFFINDIEKNEMSATTTLSKEKKTWTSTLQVPLALFNVEKGQAKGTKWRMNFFRTVVAPATFPDQLLGAWSTPDQASFHITPYFGNVLFV